MAEAVRMSTLGRAVYLGDLYDFTSDSFKHLESADQLAVKKMRRNSLCTDGIPRFEMTVCITESEELKWHLLKLDTHLKASILVGLVPKDKLWFYPYLYHEDPHSNLAQAVVFLNVYHHEMKIPDNQKLNMPNGFFTHFVSEVTHGANYIVIIEKMFSSALDKQEAESQLLPEVEHVFHLLLAGNCPRLESLSSLLLSTSCRAYSSLHSNKLQAASFSDCIGFLQNELSPSNYAEFIPIEMVINPLSNRKNFRSCEILSQDHEFVNLLLMLKQSLIQIEKRCDKLLQDQFISRISFPSHLRHRLQEFQHCLNELTFTLQKALSSGLADYRKQKWPTPSVKEVAQQFWRTYFEKGELLKWILVRQRELVTLKQLFKGVALEFVPETMVNTFSKSSDIFFFKIVQAEDLLISTLQMNLELKRTPNVFTDVDLPPVTTQEWNSLREQLLNFKETVLASSEHLVFLSTSETKPSGWRFSSMMPCSNSMSVDVQKETIETITHLISEVTSVSSPVSPGDLEMPSSCKPKELLSDASEKDEKVFAISDASSYLHLYEQPKSSLRLAEDFRNSSELLQSGVPSVYFLKSKVKATANKELRWFEIGEALEGGAEMKMEPYKVLILMGATGSGKSSLINGMVNYILGVEWSDPFRFRIVSEAEGTAKSQAHSQTSSVTAYTIHPMEGMKIKHGITLIDTPGYGDTRGVEQDKEITRIIGRFLTHSETQLSFDYVNAVCFVVSSAESRLTPTQKYILDSVFSIFGNDVATSLRLLVTFSDGMVPPVLQAIRAAEVPGLNPGSDDGILHNKFNNAALFARNQGTEEELCFDRAFWELGWTNFKLFFEILIKLPSQSLQQTRRVADSRVKLEKSLRDIEVQLDRDLEQIENMERFRSQIAQFGHKMEESFVEETKWVPHRVPIQKWALNCPQCKQSCNSGIHFFKTCIPRLPGSCSNGYCTCSGNEHKYEQFEWQWRIEKEKVLLKEKLEEFQQMSGRKLSIEEMLQRSLEEQKEIQKKIVSLLHNLATNAKSLDDSSLKSNGTTASDYLQMMKSRVELEMRPGYSTRVKTLQNLIDLDCNRPINPGKGCQRGPTRYN